MTEQDSTLHNVDQVHEAVRAEQFLPQNVDDFLRPEVMQATATNPEELFNKMVKEGVNEQEADEAVTRARQFVGKEVLLPEAVSGIVGSALEKAKTDSETALDSGIRISNNLEANLTTVHAAVASNREAFNDAQRPLQILNDYMNGAPRDPQELRAAATRLEDFVDIYSKNRTAIEQNGQEGVRPAYVIHGELEEGARQVKTALDKYEAEEHDLEVNPINPTFVRGLPEAVTERGKATLKEHQQECNKEIQDKDNQLIGIKAKMKAASAEAEVLQKSTSTLGRTADLLPKHFQMRDAVDFVKTSLYKLEAHGPMFKAQVSELIDGLNRVMQQAQSANEQVDNANNQSLEDLASLRASLIDVKRLTQ